jgi:hypothetical protein
MLPVTQQQRISLLAELGQYLREGGDEDLDSAVRRAYAENQWFTEENTRAALRAVADAFLEERKLLEWAGQYPAIAAKDTLAKTVGIVMAGNIPLVGFHDWLCVFVAGHRAKVKLSEKDRVLLPFLVQKMGEQAKESWAFTEFLQEGDKLTGFDAVIATGSNNSARYFEQYFAQYKHIIRRNRNSVAVLNGLESAEDLRALGRDIFSYFGLGCRNVSKIYVPNGYHFDFLLETLHEYNEIVLHNKYKNNFDYNLALYILNSTPHLNNGCLLLVEDRSLQSRIASLHYEYYDDLFHLDALLAEKKDEIQCVVGKTAVKGFVPVPFGASQSPTLTDYPDGVDVMQFLSGI